MKSLTQLAEEHKCDKGAAGHHTYTNVYEQYFSHIRDKPITLLEIGCGGYDNPNEGGASLRMWKEYFTNPGTHIYSVDIFDKQALQEDRITIFKGSQSDETFLKGVMEKIGTPSVIVDDGSHISSDVITSFSVLFPLLADGGIYIIEDTLTSYFRHYGGNSENSSIEFLKKLIDGLHYKESATEMRNDGLVPPEPTYTDLNILSVHFYHNMVFILKGDNSVTA